MLPLLPRVTIFSATERAALALARVVVTRLCLIRLQTKLASIALRCSPVRPSLAVRLRCRMWFLLLRDSAGILLGSFQHFGIDRHPQAHAEGGQLLFDFVERFLAEIAVLEHLIFGLHRQLA